MRPVMLVVALVALVLLGFTIQRRSELLLDLLAAWLSLAGLAFSLWNLRARRHALSIRRELGELRRHGIPGNYSAHEAALLDRAEDGIVEGLVVAGIGSVIGAIGQALFAALPGCG